ncbi:MAG: hypothetical protein GY772_01800 [bacterium]|nr:hypothetical protein [bacterium]
MTFVLDAAPALALLVLQDGLSGLMPVVTDAVLRELAPVRKAVVSAKAVTRYHMDWPERQTMAFRRLDRVGFAHCALLVMATVC